MGGGKKGMTHTWPEKEGVLQGRTLVSWSREENAGCHVRWPDSLLGEQGDEHSSQVPFVLPGLVFSSVIHTVWTLSVKMWARRLSSWTSWQGEPECLLWRAFWPRLQIFHSYHLLSSKARCYDLIPQLDSHMWTRTDVQGESLQAWSKWQETETALTEDWSNEQEASTQQKIGQK